MQSTRDNLPAVDPSVSAFGSSLLVDELAHRTAIDFAVACAEAHLAGRHLSRGHSRDRLSTTINGLRSLAAIQQLLLLPRSIEIDLPEPLLQLCYYQAHPRFADRGAHVRSRVMAVPDCATGSAFEPCLAAELN